MAYKCETCGKVAVTGSTQKHRRGVAGKRWKNRVAATKRLFRVNLQKITTNGTTETLCAKCIKRRKFDAEHSFNHI